MMKIGIISINIYTKWLNFACPLHSFAMQEFLRKNGYESQVIDYKASYYDNYNMRYPADYYKAKYEYRQKNFPLNPDKRGDWFKSMKLTKELEINYRALYDQRASRYNKFSSFVDNYLVKTEKGFNSASMEFDDPGFDCYMCVTDVIWKSEPLLERAFFLANKCMDNKYKIAYSASRGSSYTKTPEQEKLFFDYLRDFDAISVREPSLKEHIEEKSELKATVVLDPVMLHDVSFYEKIAKKPEEKGYMFLYHVVQSADDTIQQAVKYAKAHNLMIIESSDRPYPEGKLTSYEGIEHKWVYDMSVEQWLGYIMNADCVFTNSFHCCCFSIISGRKFFAGSRNGDKVDTVLSTFGLEDRRFDINTDILSNEPEDIDYEKVHAILAEKRKESGDFLLDALKRIEGNPRQPKDYDAQRMTVTYPIYCNMNVPSTGATVKERSEKSPEFRSLGLTAVNDGTAVLSLASPFLQGYRFLGWSLRCRVDNEYYYFMNDGTFAPVSDDIKPALFKDGAAIPYIPANGIVSVTADAQWEKHVPNFAVCYNSGLKAKNLDCSYDENLGELAVTDSGKYEYRLNRFYINDQSAVVPANCFEAKGSDKDKRFMGWKIRFWLDTGWYWYMNDGSSVPAEEMTQELKKDIRVFKEGEKLPKLPVGLISNVVLCAQWELFDLTIAYHSGSMKAENTVCSYSEDEGEITVTPSGAYEYKLKEKISNRGLSRFMQNGFVTESTDRYFAGWTIRVKTKKGWEWYLEDESLVPLNEYSAEAHGKKKVFPPEGKIQGLKIPGKSSVVAVAVWRKKQSETV